MLKKGYRILKSGMTWLVAKLLGLFWSVLLVGWKLLMRGAQFMRKGCKYSTDYVVWLRSRLQFGRILRRLGLPLWILLGIGIAGWMFDPAATLLQQLIAAWLELENKPTSWKDFMPSVVLLFIPIVVVIGITIVHGFAPTRKNKGEQKPSGKKGLILLVSRAESAKFAIDFHFLKCRTLEQIWLIPSNETASEYFGGSSMKEVPIIEAYCQQLEHQEGRPLDVKVHEVGVSPADAQDTYDVVHRIFRRSKYEPDELIADFTGGTKPMSVGMIMACLPRARDLEYVSGKRDAEGDFQSYGPFVIDYQHSAFDLLE